MLLNNMQVNKINNIIKNNRDRFFNYNQNSCWLDTFLFIIINILFTNIIYIMLRI